MRKDDLRTPWMYCPTIWDAFCEEFNVKETKLFKYLYRRRALVIHVGKERVVVNTAFRIYYDGFMRGGCSYPP